MRVTRWWLPWRREAGPLDRTGPATRYLRRDGNPCGNGALWWDLVRDESRDDGADKPPDWEQPTAEHRVLRVPPWVYPERS